MASIGAGAFHWVRENSNISNKTYSPLNSTRGHVPTVITTRDSYNQGSYKKGFLKPGVLPSEVLTTRGSYSLLAEVSHDEAKMRKMRKEREMKNERTERDNYM